MNKDSNAYTLLYAAGLVVIVATILAVTAIGLKRPQEKNIEIEKKLNILSSVGKGTITPDVDSKNNFVEEQYDKYIIETFIVDGNGERKEGDAFLINMKEEYDKIKKIKSAKEENKPELRQDLNLPVFVYKDDDENLKYIVPVYGLGLWGPIWGYLSLNDDFNTIYGAIFNHKSETPGLGAEIVTPSFTGQFSGKQIFQGDSLTSVKIVKGGASQDDKHGVDAISGGTITSQGVEAMLYDCFEEYKTFLLKIKETKHE
jgi:Na+-transporting NADH:ubiquinone oxidoreductase subunit C